MKTKKGKFFEASKLAGILMAILLITILFSAVNVRSEDPAQTGASPTNGATGLRLTPNLYVMCVDNDTVDTMNATWWWINSTGSWFIFATDSGIANNTNISQTNANFSSPGTLYWWSVNLTDGTNWTNATYSFTTDGTPPTVADIGYSSSSNYYKDADTVTVYANLTESGSGILESSVKISIDYTSGADISGAAMSKVDNTHWTYSWNIPSGSDGNVNVSVEAVDNASLPLSGVNWSNSKYVDNTAPSLTTVTIASSNSNPTYAKVGDTVNITIVANSNLLTPTVIIDGNPAGVVGGSGANWWATRVMQTGDTAGTVGFLVNYSDLAGNYGAEVTAITAGSNVVFDETAPTASITTPATATWYNSLINISGSASGASTVNITVFNLTGGKYWNGTLWTTWNDTTSWLGTNGTTSWYNNSGVPTWTNGSTYIVNATATDVASNTGSGSNTFYYDTTAPVVTVTALSTYKTSNFVVSWSAVEAGSGVASWTVEYKENVSGAWMAWLTNVSYVTTSSTWLIGNTTDGCTVYFRALGVDNASNCGGWSAAVSTTKDTTAPTATISVPVDGTWYSSLTNISGSASDATSGVSYVNITVFNLTGDKYWNGTLWTTWNDTTSWLGTNGTTSWYNNSGVPTWTSGSQYIINATATDSIGNVGNKESNHFLFDTLSSISAGSPTTSSATITWTTSANTNSSAEYGLSTSYGSSSSDTAYATSHSIPLTGLSSASTYHYRVTSVDAFGNSNTSSDHTFDTATGGSSPPPSPPSNPPTADAGGPYTGTVGTAVQFDGSASTAASGKTISSYSWNFGDGSTGTGATTTHTYTTAGTYTVRLTVTDNQGATDSDSTTATISALPEELPSETVSDQTMNEINEDYGVTLEEPFYANDTNGDGIVDTFTDPNNVLTNVNYVDINGNASFLISTNEDNIPEFFWDTTTNAVTPVTHATAQTTTEPLIDPVEGTVTIQINVSKSNWIYIDVSDAYPDYTVTVKTSDDRTISEDMIWRENGKIYVLDDPDTIYDFLYGYIIAPTFSPITVTTFDTSKPTITITYQEQVTITTALFGTNDIIDQITPTNGTVFTFTAGSDITDGTYTLSITAVDGQGNTLESTATYTIKTVEKVVTPAAEFPWLIAIIAAIIVILLIIVALFKTGYLYLDQEPAEEPKEEKIEIPKEEPTETKKKPTKPKKK